MHNLNIFSGPQQPSWNPQVPNNLSVPKIKQYTLPLVKLFPFFVAECAISPSICKSLLKQFDEQDKYPVGVDGYSTGDNVGSYRSMGWSPDVAQMISQQLERFCPEIITEETFPLCFPHEDRTFTYLGSTPWLRFMKYSSGGKHTPHYDAPFWNEQERYATLFSWVLYLNTPDGEGGAFQFINDPQQLTSHPTQWDRSDHRTMGDSVLCSIPAEEGTLLVFPHWLCHQVEEFLGAGNRYIIRGDVAYGY